MRGALAVLLLALEVTAASASAQEGAEGHDATLLERPGAALRHAVWALEAGEIDRAEALLAALAQRHPVIADHADLLRMRLLVDAGRVEAATALGQAWNHPDSPLGVEVGMLLGRAWADLGEEARAREAWSSALASAVREERRAELNLELARSFHRTGRAAEAGERLLEIWVETPTSAAADEAERNLEAVEGELGRSLRTGDDWRKRGDALYRQRYNESALAAYEASLADASLASSARRRALTQRAHTLFRLRRYSDAAGAYAALPKIADNQIEWARSLARAGDVPRAARELEAIGQRNRNWRGVRARYLAALLWDGEEDEASQQRARELFAWLARESRSSNYGANAVWRLGWDAYRNGRHADAAAHFDALRGAPDVPDHDLDGLRVRYWWARAAEQAGIDGAADEFGTLARQFPLSYYGWRARTRAALGPSGPPPFRFDAGDVMLSADQRLRPRILLEAGLVEEARAELDRLKPLAGGVRDRLALAELYGEADDFHEAQTAVVGGYVETLARGPGQAPIELWWHAWPLPFVDEVRVATRGQSGVEPALVYAVMREESGYRPAVRSVSGAIGLLQLMPETATQVADRIALEGFRPDDLVVPGVNIRLGAAYLEQLLGQFEGRESAAIASYNAGPHRVVRWLEGSALEDDEWVEAIPYDQTRSYVKRVLRSLHAYRVLY